MCEDIAGGSNLSGGEIICFCMVRGHLLRAAMGHVRPYCQAIHVHASSEPPPDQVDGWPPVTPCLAVGKALDLCPRWLSFVDKVDHAAPREPTQ